MKPKLKEYLKTNKIMLIVVTTALLAFLGYIIKDIIKYSISDQSGELTVFIALAIIYFVIIFVDYRRSSK